MAFYELLEPTKSEKHGGYKWEPTDNDHSPEAGVLTISGKWSWCRYRVEEFPADEPGRAFVLLKMDEGTDKTEEHYSCFIGKSGERICECKGFTRFGHCKHLSSLESLIENGQL